MNTLSLKKSAAKVKSIPQKILSPKIKRDIAALVKSTRAEASTAKRKTVAAVMDAFSQNSRIDSTTP